MAKYYCYNYYLTIYCFKKYITDISPVNRSNRKSSGSSVETNFYNLSDPLIIVEKSPHRFLRSEAPTTRRISLQNGPSSPQDSYLNHRNRGSSLEKEYVVCREKRNPLLDKVKNTKLSCFKSNGPLNHGDDVTSTSGSDCSGFGHVEDTSHCRYNYPDSHIEFENPNPWEKMSCYDDDVFMAKGATPTECRWRDKSFSGRGSRCYSSGSDCDRFHSIPKVGNKLSKSSDQIFNDDYEPYEEVVTPTNSKFQKKTDKNKSKDDKDTIGPNSCLSAKLRAMSDRYFKTSTNKLISKFYRPHIEEVIINKDVVDSTTPALRTKKKKGGVKAKLRSFSYGALPGLEEFQKGQSVFHDNIYQASCDDENLIQDCEDTDSGILVNDSATPSIIEGDRISSRCDSSASQVHCVLSCHARSVSGDQGHTKVRMSRRVSRDRTDYPRPRPRQSQRALSLDRKEVLRRMPKDITENTQPQYLQLTEKQKMRQRDVSQGDDIVPPIPPCKKSVKQAMSEKSVSEFKVVRIIRTKPCDELGIYIAKTKLSDEGHIGYLVAYVVPGGLAES